MTSELRKKIDKLDEEIVDLLARRIESSRELIEEEKKAPEPFHLKTWEIETLDKAKLKGNSLGLRDEFIVSLYQVILAEVRLTQS